METDFSVVVRIWRRSYPIPSFRREPESILILVRERKWIPAFAGTTECEDFARLRRIAIDLPHHRVEIRELRLVAQLRDELDVDAPAVEITVEIEEMRLEQRLGAVDRRPDAETRNAGQRIALDA